MIYFLVEIYRQRLHARYVVWSMEQSRWTELHQAEIPSSDAEYLKDKWVRLGNELKRKELGEVVELRYDQGVVNLATGALMPQLQLTPRRPVPL